MTTAVEVLGERFTVAGWTLAGPLPPQRMAKVLEEVVARMGMSTGGLKPVVYQYPLPDGRGGVGHTICLPFGEQNQGGLPGWWKRLRWRLATRLLDPHRFASMVFQPLVESFVVSDDYPDLNLTRVIAASCLPFDQLKVRALLADEIGPVVAEGEMAL